jgi:S-DNA-T family DNA segregation ATPase FtsK/SpoIIIE
VASLVRRIKLRPVGGNAARLAGPAAVVPKLMPGTAGAGQPDTGQANGSGRFIPELDANGFPRISSELPPDFHPLSTGPQAASTVAERHLRSRMDAPTDTANANPGATAQARGARAARPAGTNPAQRPAPLPPWKQPPVAEILEPAALETVTTNQDKERGELIEQTLASFGVPVKVVATNHGPTVTQFGVEPQLIVTHNAQGDEKKTRVRVSRIVALADGS